MSALTKINHTDKIAYAIAAQAHSEAGVWHLAKWPTIQATSRIAAGIRPSLMNAIHGVKAQP